MENALSFERSHPAAPRTGEALDERQPSWWNNDLNANTVKVKMHVPKHRISRTRYADVKLTV